MEVEFYCLWCGHVNDDGMECRVCHGDELELVSDEPETEEEVDFFFEIELMIAIRKANGELL